MKKLFILALLISCALLASIAPAQEKSADEIAAELANPNNSLASLNFRNQYYWYKGTLPHADDQGNYMLLFQPTFPFVLGAGRNLFVRPAIPVVFSQPTFNAETGDFEGVTSLADIGFDLAYGKTSPTGLITIFGIVGTLPTATDDAVKGHQFRLGPELAVIKGNKWGLYGLFPSHQWDVTGQDYGPFSATNLQVFLVFLPGGGWNVGTQPTMSYNWVSEEWTIPLHVSVGKTLIAGKTPIKLALEFNYFIDKPDVFAPELMIGFNINPVVPNIFNNWIQGK